MKKIFSVLFIVFQFSFFAFSHDFHLSIEPIFGMRNGQVDEFVYSNISKYSEDKLSELNWDLKNEFYLGGRISGGWKKLFGNVSFTSGLSGKSGMLSDSDWKNIDYLNCEDKLYKTNLSKHDNNLEHDYDFYIDGGYNFSLFTSGQFGLVLRPYLGYEYRNIKFNAQDGQLWYGHTIGQNSHLNYGPYYRCDDEEHQWTESFSGKVIAYSRFSSIFWTGLDIGISLPLNFTINLGFLVSPYTYSESIDNHMSSGKVVDYGDKTPSVFGLFDGKFGVEYRIAKQHFVNLNFVYHYMRETRGSDYMREYGQALYKRATVADGGAAEHYFDLSLSYKFKIF